MNFILDNNLPPKLAHGLREFAKPEHPIYHLKDKFPHNAKDVDWLRGLEPEYRWGIITCDLNIGRRPHERAAFEQAGHAVFFLGKSWLNLQPPFWRMASKLTHYLPNIIALAEKKKGAFSLELPVRGNIKLK